jgi:hypothetical protein
MYKDEDQIEEERFYETRDLFSELQVQLEELDVGSIWRYKGMLEPWYQVCEGANPRLETLRGLVLSLNDLNAEIKKMKKRDVFVIKKGDYL